MRRAAQVIIDDLDELSALLAREQGKPRNEAYVMELIPSIDALRWIADAGPGHPRRRARLAAALHEAEARPAWPTSRSASSA